MSIKQNINLDKIEKVISFGCSWSDYMFGTDVVYGEYLAKELNSEYLHHGIGCGSNDRIWRRFFEYGRNGFLDETTLITIQWTELERKEMFSAFGDEIVGGQHQDDYNKTGYHEVCKHLDGYLYKFKHDAYSWVYNKPMRKYMYHHTNYNLSREYSLDLWKNYNYSIKNYCELNNIPLIFISHRSYNEYHKESENEYFHFIDVDNIYRHNPRIMEDGNDDFAHTSTKGHELVAFEILNKIK